MNRRIPSDACCDNGTCFARDCTCPRCETCGECFTGDALDEYEEGTREYCDEHMPKCRGRILHVAASGAVCEVCKAEMSHLAGYVPIPASHVCALFATDYAGLNMGIEANWPDANLCIECVGNCLPWCDPNCAVDLHPEQTGGGCTALVGRTESGLDVLVTDDDANTPTIGERFVVGLYAAEDGEPVVQHMGDTYDPETVQAVIARLVVELLADDGRGVDE